MMNPLIMPHTDLMRYVVPSTDAEEALLAALKEAHATIADNHNKASAAVERLERENAALRGRLDAVGKRVADTFTLVNEQP